MPRGRTAGVPRRNRQHLSHLSACSRSDHRPELPQRKAVLPHPALGVTRRAAQQRRRLPTPALLLPSQPRGPRLCTQAGHGSGAGGLLAGSSRGGGSVWIHLGRWQRRGGWWQLPLVRAPRPQRLNHPSALLLLLLFGTAIVARADAGLRRIERRQRRRAVAAAAVGGVEAWRVAESLPSSAAAAAAAAGTAAARRPMVPVRLIVIAIQRSCYQPWLRQRRADGSAMHAIVIGPRLPPGGSSGGAPPRYQCCCCRRLSWLRALPIKFTGRRPVPRHLVAPRAAAAGTLCTPAADDGLGADRVGGARRQGRRRPLAHGQHERGVLPPPLLPHLLGRLAPVAALLLRWQARPHLCTPGRILIPWGRGGAGRSMSAQDDGIGAAAGKGEGGGE